MNSIRDSCKSIEELDLGANKLSDLIEVYKILQFTPNLRFLNLSGNDLSKTSPVAVATGNANSSFALSQPQPQQITTLAAGNVFVPSSVNHLVNSEHQSSHQQNLPLSQLSQNANQQQNVKSFRSRSTLNQSATISARAMMNNFTSTNRAPAARRLAAALAQSQKTSSRSAASSVAAAAAATSKNRINPRNKVETSGHSIDTANSKVASESSARPRVVAKSTNLMARREPSTLHLARSLSSLSNADCRRRRATGVSQVASSAASRTRTSANILNMPTTSNASVQVGSTGGPVHFRRTFDSIKALALNNTRCQWKTVCSILQRMPNLEELHLSLNDYERIELEPCDFKHPNLKRLYLCNNPKLTNWFELDKLVAAFPQLEALSMADCAISQIPDNLDTERRWRKLCGLNINGWPIKEWPIIERLNQLPSLVDLKCRNLEILNDIDKPRHHLIARLPKLLRLNGSEIEEREFAEKDFVRFFMINSHLERPVRFHELLQIHGPDLAFSSSNVNIDVDLSPPNQARVCVIYLNRNFNTQDDNDDIFMSEDFLSKLMQTTTKSNDDFDINQEDDDKQLAKLLHKDDSQEVMAMSIDLRQSVRKFKANLSSIFGLSVDSTNDLLLYYIDHEMIGLMGPELLKYNQKKLWNYNVQNGDQFIIERR